MEPITHFLTGACLGRAGLNRKTALATAATTLAAEAPDLIVGYNVISDSRRTPNTRTATPASG